MKTQKLISTLALMLGLLVTSTAWGLMAEPSDPTAELMPKTPVTQTTCKSVEEVPFAYLSMMEKRLLTSAVDLFNGEDTQTAGCFAGPGTAFCEGMGYVCWVQVFEGGPGEPDVLDYGCSKQTC